MKYCFLLSHVDDEICCSGLMHKLIQQGHEVDCLAWSHCEQDILIKEFTESMLIIGVNHADVGDFPGRKFNDVVLANKMFDLRDKYDFFITHSMNDKHTAHREVGKQALRVLNGNLFTFIAPWNGTIQENYFVELSEENLQAKIKSMQCYQSQSHRPYMNEEYLRSQAIVTGMKCGYKYAEGFNLIRLKA